MNQIEVVSSLESLGNIKINKGTTVEDLVAFALRAETVFNIYDTHNAVVRFQQGRALSAAKKRFTGKGWRKYIESQGISAMTDSRARRLAEAAKSEAKVRGLTLTEAYRTFLKPTTTRQKTKKAVEKRAEDTAPTPSPLRKPPSKKELVALTDFLAVVGTYERAKELVEIASELRDSSEGLRDTKEEASV
jgi:hypothetical protein